MDPIELQIQQRINEIQNTPGFTNYTPSFEQNLQPQGIAPLVDSSMQNNFVTGPVQIDPKQIAGNILKNQGIKFAAKKFGLGKIGQNVLGSMIGYSTPFAPLAAVSALKGPSLGIANVLRNKRIEKAIMRDANRDSQGNINILNAKIANMQPSARDVAMGGGDRGGGSSSSSSTSGSRSSGGYGGGQERGRGDDF